MYMHARAPLTVQSPWPSCGPTAPFLLALAWSLIVPGLPLTAQQPGALTTSHPLALPIPTHRQTAQVYCTSNLPRPASCRAPPPRPSVKSPPRLSRPGAAARPLPGGLRPRAARRPPRPSGPPRRNGPLRPSGELPSAARPPRGERRAGGLVAADEQGWGGVVVTRYASLRKG